jgi:hypothetical protein
MKEYKYEKKNESVSRSLEITCPDGSRKHTKEEQGSVDI